MSELFEQVKKEMVQTVSKMTPSTVEETKDKINKYFNLANVMFDILQGESAKVLEEEVAEKKPDVQIKKDFPIAYKIKTEVPVKIETKEKESLDALAASFEEEKKVVGFPLDRKLSGGFLYLGNSSVNIYVPESIIRSEGFENGDLIYAEPIPGTGTRTPMYTYTLVEKAKVKTTNNRNEFTHGLVEFDEQLKQYYVEKSADGTTLRIKDVPMKFLIPKKDLNQFGIVTGDIVDIAWYNDSLEKGKVSWRHSLQDATETKTDSKKMMDFKKKQTVEADTRAKKAETNIPQTLAGKKICLVGADPYHPDFKEVVEEHGGTFYGILSNTHKVSMAATIRKSDLVLVCISHTSHRDSQYANEKAKSYKVPFKSFSGFGKGLFLMSIYSALKIDANEVEPAVKK